MTRKRRWPLFMVVAYQFYKAYRAAAHGWMYCGWCDGSSLFTVLSGTGKAAEDALLKFAKENLQMRIDKDKEAEV